MLIMLNSNIRCIEIKQNIPYRKHRYCWIVTLDVLKSDFVYVKNYLLGSWIVTLDVLK